MPITRNELLHLVMYMREEVEGGRRRRGVKYSPFGEGRGIVEKFAHAIKDTAVIHAAADKQSRRYLHRANYTRRVILNVTDNRDGGGQ